jgi:putative selenium metabolism hydrolase
MDIAKQILDKAEKLSDYTAKNLSEVIKIPSLSAEEEQVIAKLKEQCEIAGFDEVRVDGLGSLIARIGNGPKILAIDAHIDTVDVGDRDQWDFDPFCGDIKDGKVLGRGTVDQEGGAASMITAGKILKELNYDGEYSIYFTFTVMEEDCDGLCWNYIIEKEKLVPVFAVITEPTNMNLYRGHRGRMELEVHCKGLSCHGSAPERGDNAIYKVAKTAIEIEELHNNLSTDEFLGKGSICASMIKSNSPSLCAVADYSMMHLDKRLTWGETLESSVEEVAAAAKDLGEVKVPIYERRSYKGTLFTQEKYFPTWKIEEDHDLVKAGVKTYESLFESKPKIDKWTFSTNAVSICGKHKIPCIGFGPGNEIYAHAPNEFVPIEHLDKAAAFYALLPYILEK